MTDLTLSDIYDPTLDTEGSGKHRAVDLGNNKIHIKCEDPFGFWYITFERGGPPKEMRGAYTTLGNALKDINKYLNKKNKEAILKETKVA
jgi:hypothetical protein